TIPGGQRDGVTDINWKLTFNNQQFYYFLTNGLSYLLRVRLGDSNADSNLINDRHDRLKGNEIAYIAPSRLQWLEYSSGNDYRDLMLEFSRSQAKGNIAEIILMHYRYISGYQGYYEENGLCRVTFDPPLDNTDSDYRLFLTF